MSAEPEVSALKLESVECSPVGEQILIRLRGRWRSRQRGSQAGAILILENDGRSYRFPAIAQPRRGRLAKPGAWSASFALPAWLEPHLAGGTSLTIGEVTTRVPAESFLASPSPQNLAEGPAEADGNGSGPAEFPAAGTVPAGGELGSPAGRRIERGSEEERPSDDDESTISALRTELQARAGAEGRVRGQLVDAQAQAKARAGNQAQLESAHAELRQELDRLRALVERESSGRAEIESRAVALAAQVAEIQEQVAELSASRDLALGERDRLAHELADVRAELAVSSVAREAASSEALGLRAELERLGTELASAREHASASTGDLGEAEALLVEARALNASIRARQGGGPSPAAEPRPSH